MRSFGRPLGVAAVALAVAAGAILLLRESPVPSFRAQACGLPRPWLGRIQRGYFPGHSGEISIVPKIPAYFATGKGGWTHSGPWNYLQDVPLVFYGPGFVPAVGEVDDPATLADIAPTLATLLKGSFRTDDGHSLDRVARLDASLLGRPAPRLVVVVVWDGGGWNAIEQWPGDWPTLGRISGQGVGFSHATVGSSPSVTPSVHTTIGTGFFPWVHGVTGIPVRDETGEIVDSFDRGESGRFLQVPTFAERWDEQTGNRAKVGMVGYEPWHLGMIGKGAERPTGDRDDAAWLDTETNEWITNPDHYNLPESLAVTPGLQQELEKLDAADGAKDRSWLDNEILDDPERWEETPAFIRYHTTAMMNMIAAEGYGTDEVTDLLFTNYKQIDRVGHYFNMTSEEVHASLIETDRQLKRLIDFLDTQVGREKWVIVMTADHGQQPDAKDVDGFSINPRELERDIDAEFGSITETAWPTEIFLKTDAMEGEGISVADVARFLGSYRVGDNLGDDDRPTGSFGTADRVFAAAVPSDLLPRVRCRRE